MKIAIRFRDLQPSEALREHAVRRALFQLSRFGHEIRSVHLRIGDVNGPKGGVDKQCQVTVKGRRLSTMVIDDLSADPYSAVDIALERVGRAVGRELERVRAARSVLPSTAGRAS